MIEDTDELTARIAGALRPLPFVDESAKARLLVAVAAERERDRELAVRRSFHGRLAWSVAGAAGLAAAVMVATLTLHQAPHTVASAPAPMASTAPAVQLAAHDANVDPASAPQEVQLVFRAPAAGHVRVVGDFNGWDAQRAPMAREAGTGLWSVTLSLRPGRHVYAFVVDDTLWMRDPRAPAAPDADFGRPGSVLLVGRP
ncbi:MAG: hypothetical protein JWM95_5268 [Gemmatimonadetes bacterium]|nr:hypothetical protein [Gemmatimonadota bacterium]